MWFRVLNATVHFLNEVGDFWAVAILSRIVLDPTVSDLCHDKKRNEVVIHVPSLTVPSLDYFTRLVLRGFNQFCNDLGFLEIAKELVVIDPCDEDVNLCACEYEDRHEIND